MSVSAVNGILLSVAGCDGATLSLDKYVVDESGELWVPRSCDIIYSVRVRQTADAPAPTLACNIEDLLDEAEGAFVPSDELLPSGYKLWGWDGDRAVNLLEDLMCYGSLKVSAEPGAVVLVDGRFLHDSARVEAALDVQDEGSLASKFPFDIPDDGPAVRVENRVLVDIPNEGTTFAWDAASVPFKIRAAGMNLLVVTSELDEIVAHGGARRLAVGRAVKFWRLAEGMTAEIWVAPVPAVYDAADILENEHPDVEEGV